MPVTGKYGYKLFNTEIILRPTSYFLLLLYSCFLQTILQFIQSSFVFSLAGHPMVPLEIIFHKAHAFAFYGMGNYHTGFTGFKRQTVKGFFKRLNIVPI